MTDRQCEPEQFNDRLIFMSMYNDIVWEEKGNTEKCEFNSRTVANYARRFPHSHWSFLGPGSEKKWCGTYSDKRDGVWSQTAEQMMNSFAETSHPIFRASNALERGKLRSKAKGKKTIHFNGSEEKCRINSSHDNFCKSAQCLRSSSRLVQGTIQRYHGFGETWSTWSFANDVKFLLNLLLLTLVPMNGRSTLSIVLVENA